MERKSSRRIVGRATVLAVLAALVAAAPAAAASGVSESAGTVYVTGDAGASHITTTDCLGTCGEGVVRFEDTTGATAGDGCTQVDGTQVDCTNVTAVIANLGEGNDYFYNDCCDNFAPTSQTINGGGGNDDINGLSNNVPDTINGGAGDDKLNGDTGNDTIHGNDGNDTILGEAGNDTAFGDAGDDTVRGGRDDDAVDGGAGLDTLEGDEGPASTGDGNDHITARDGQVDQIGCGFGADVVTADASDVIDTGACESIDRGPGGGGGGDTTAPTAKVGGRTTQTLGKFIVVTITSNENGTATAGGTLSVPNAAKAFKLRKKTKHVSAGVKVKLKLKLSAKARAAARRALRRGGKVKAKIKIRVKDAAGNTTTKTRKVKLKL